MANPYILAWGIGLARRAKGMKQKELANMIGVTPQAISSYESLNGKRKIPSLHVAISLAEALGCSLDWLCGIDSCDEGDEECLKSTM
jgi:transcriptional regulator with XRE-family HTH domain